MTTATNPSLTRRGFAWLLVIVAGLLTAATLPAQTLVTWNGSGTNSANTNWSFSANWTGGTPGATANIYFTNAGVAAAVASVNNIVDANNTVLSLAYANTNGYHTTLIKPGFTLTVSNSAATNLVYVGTGTDNGNAQVVNATITGPGGTLAVASTNAGSQMIVQQGSASAGAHAAILDLSGLGNFTLTAGRLLVGGNPSITAIGASNYLSGILNLALTNVITLNGTAPPQLNLGDDIQNVNTSYTNTILLGQTNALYADSVTIGHGKTPGLLKFNPALAGNNPQFYLRGNSAARVATLSIGDNSDESGTSSSSTGNLDLSLGTVNAQVTTCYLGRGQNSAASTGPSYGTLTISNGVFNVNTLYAGYVNTNAAVYSVAGTNNVIGAGAVLYVNTALYLGYNPSLTVTNTCFAKGVLNITNGAVYANAITNSSGLSNGVAGLININGGSLTITNTAGSPALPLGTISLTTAALHLDVASTAVTNICATNLVMNGTTTVTVDSIVGYLSGTNTYPLISYLSGTDPYANLSLSLPGSFGGMLVDNSAARRIDLQITNGPVTPILGTVVWGGGLSGNWNSTTANWTNGGITTVYQDTDTVLFNDTAQTAAVSLITNVQPAAVIFSNSTLSYTLSGPSNITGSATLTKLGTGTATLSTTNSYTGGTFVDNGTLTLGVPGALPAGTPLCFNGISGIANATLNLGGQALTVSALTFTNIGTNTVTITGGPSLTVTNSTLTFAPNTTTNNLTVNLSGLPLFTYTNNSGTFAVANGAIAESGSASQTTVTLASGTNSLTAGTFDVGTSTTSGGTVNSTLNLGTNNTLHTGTFNFGDGRAGATLQFASGITGGTLTIAGTTGGATTANLIYVGHDSYQVSDHVTDLFDLTAGTLTAQLGNVVIGQASPNSSMTSNRGITMASSFKMGAGTLTASNLTLAQINGATGDTGSFAYNYTNNSVFSLTNGGTANITTLTIASNSYTGNLTANCVLSGIVSLTNGATLNSANIQEGTIATPATGNFNVTAELLWGDGTLGNLAGGGLTVNGIAIVLAGAANNHSVNISSGQSGTLYAWISGTGTLTDAGAGALTLHGNNSFNGALVLNSANSLTLQGTNTYTGSTLINSGTLVLNGVGTITSSPLISVAGGATFNVASLTSTFVLGAGQTLSNNASATARLNGNLNTGAGTLAVSWTSGTPAFTVTNGTLTLSNATTVNVNNTGSVLAPGSYELIGTATGGSVALATQPSVTVTGGGLTAGTTASLSVSGGQLYLNVSTVSTTTALTLLTGANPSTYGDSLTFQAAINPAPADGETVTFYDGATSLGTGNTAGGLATLTTAALTGGGHSLTAVYGGDTTYAGSTSGALPQTVNPAAPGLVIGSSVNPVGYLGGVAFTATLPADATGSAVFASTNGTFSTNSLSGGAATSLAITNLARGTNVITVAYGGDANYLGATNLFNQIVTNHSPVAAVMTVTVTAGLGAEIALTDLATNWIDPDGDTVELTAVNLTSTNGVTLFPIGLTTNLDGSYVITNTAYLGYANSANVADQISYSIGDSQGGTNIGYINIVLAGSVTGTNSITGITGGNPNGLTAYGVPGFDYITERSTNLTDWVEISTNTAATNGVINIIDSFGDLGSNAPPAAYYRLLWQP